MTGSTYSDDAFDAALDEIEASLGDLYGIESVAKAVLDWGYHPEDPVLTTTIGVTLPTRRPFEVYPSLPSHPDFEAEGAYQGWVDEVFGIGRSGASGTTSWLKYVADNYYAVDAKAIRDAAVRQGELTHAMGVDISTEHAELSAWMTDHWESESAGAFSYWFAQARTAVGALLVYADSAQICAGATGDAIQATQNLLMAQVEDARDALQDAVKAWRDDYDVFPFRPGSGYKISALGSTISEKMDTYVAKIPGSDSFLGGKAVDAAIDKVTGKIPGFGQASQAYSLLTEIDDARNVDSQTPATAQELITSLEDSLRAIAKEGDDSIEKLTAPIERLAARIHTNDALRLDRLDRTPDGVYES